MEGNFKVGSTVKMLWKYKTCIKLDFFFFLLDVHLNIHLITWYIIIK